MDRSLATPDSGDSADAVVGTLPGVDDDDAPRRPIFEARPLLGLIVVVGALLLAVVASVMIGRTGTISPASIWSAIFDGRDSTPDGPVVLDRRLPRTVIGLLAGLGLGVAGAVIQAVSRNPLADPGILGVAAGSSFAVAIAVGFFGVTTMLGYVWFAFGGALIATVIVYLIGSTGPGGISPARLTLAGVAFGAVLSGLTTSMTVVDRQRFAVIQAWRSGSLELRDDWALVAPAAPFIIGGIVLAILITPALNVIALSDDHAASLGANVTLIRSAAVVAVTLLAGGASALIGPLSFVGLMIPHVARWIVGPDQRWIVAYTVAGAPMLLLAADIVARLVLATGEIPASLVTAAIGAPILIYLVRRPMASGL